jgi:hypothetical protein
MFNQNNYNNNYNDVGESFLRDVPGAGDNRAAGALIYSSGSGADGMPVSSSTAISKEHREVLERAKIALAMREDFNLIDAFRVFDSEGKGWITGQQIVEGLHTGLRCYVQLQDVQLFLNVFDKESNGRLKYSEFCDAFLPLDTHYAGQLAQKPPQDKYRQVDAASQDPYQINQMKENMFSFETKKAFTTVWKTHIMICQ